ncbi:MAG: type II secretion system protein N [Burkholderiales bacterium]
MLSRSVAFLVWALVAATCVFWGTRLLARPVASSALVVAPDQRATANADVSRLLGAAPQTDSAPVEAAPEISSRFRLTGVVAPKHDSEQGLALISVDGNPPRVYRVGAAIDGDLTLREVSLRTATVASSRNGNDPGSSFVLELPPLTPAATGGLPQGGITIQQFAPPATPGTLDRDPAISFEPPAAGRPQR